MIRVIDNLVTKSYADTIEHDAFKIMQYCYVRETSFNTNIYAGPIFKDENTIDYGQFSCPILHLNDNVQFRWYFDLLKSLIYSIQDSVPEIEIKGINRIKFNLLLQQPNAPINHYNIAHQDSDSKTYSAVYYCNDTDGDTFLFNEFYDQDNPPEKLTIFERVQPKKNRLVVFESNRFHASSNPILNKERIVINFVFDAMLR